MVKKTTAPKDWPSYYPEDKEEFQEIYEGLMVSDKVGSYALSFRSDLRPIFMNSGRVLVLFAAYLHNIEGLEKSERDFPLYRIRDTCFAYEYPTHTSVGVQANALRDKLLSYIEAPCPDYLNLYVQPASEDTTKRYENSLVDVLFTNHMYQRAEKHFSETFRMSKTMFYLLLVANTLRSLTPTRKKKLKEYLDGFRFQEFMEQLEAYKSQNQTNYEFFQTQLDTPIPGLRVKYGRQDISLRRYFNV